MTKQEASQKWNEEFQDRLKSTIFPQEELPANLNVWKHAALQFESPASIRPLGLSWFEYKVLLMKEANYNLFEMAGICNIIETKTPNQVQPYVTDNYYDMQSEIMAIQKRWNEIVTPIREAIDRKIEIMTQAGGQMNTKPLKMIRS